MADVPLYVLLGDPVEHSVSPAIQRAAFRRLGLEATYRTVRVGAGELPGVLRRYAAGGGGNVTLPHKERAAAALNIRTPEVDSTGACNCFWGTDREEVAGDNTDVPGFLAAVAELPDAPSLAGGRVLLLGAGGAARAVLAACRRTGAGRVDVLNRTVSRARRLAARAHEGPDIGVLEGPDEARGPYDLAVNATSLGLRPDDALPCDPRRVDVKAILDLVYAPGGTRWVREAREAGIPAADGREMLVRQAAFSLQRWFPGVDPPLEAMREAAAEALEARASR